MVHYYGVCSDFVLREPMHIIIVGASVGHSLAKAFSSSFLKLFVPLPTLCP